MKPRRGKEKPSENRRKAIPGGQREHNNSEIAAYTCALPNTRWRDQWSGALKMNKARRLSAKRRIGHTNKKTKNDTGIARVGGIKKKKERAKGRDRQSETGMRPRRVCVAAAAAAAAAAATMARIVYAPVYVRIMFTRAHMHLHKHDNGRSRHSLATLSTIY